MDPFTEPEFSEPPPGAISYKIRFNIIRLEAVTYAVKRLGDELENRGNAFRFPAVGRGDFPLTLPPDLLWN
jgi:hypothetical protein